MRLQLTPRALLLSALLVPVSRAAADETTGTWTGKVEGAGNYYWERSTRVIVPTVGAEIESPNGTRVGVEYLVDVISSASIAQTGSDADAVFTELRHGVHVSLGNELEVGETPLDLSVRTGYSTEDDYTSSNVGVATALSLDERATVLRLSVSGNHDDIRSNADATRQERLDGIASQVSWEQIVSPTVVVTTGYQLGYLDGFQSNIYRRALKGPLPFAEDHPDERFRHSAFARLRVFVPDTATALHFMPRVYLDSWDILAVNPEFRIYQELGSPALLVRLRYRFYAQTAADFYRETYPAGFEGHVTNDPKMMPFRTHYAGIKLDVGLDALAGSFLDFTSRGRLFVSFDRIWNTNTYGNGIVLQAGGALPF